MKRMISFGSIGQFRDVLRNITHASRFVGLDEEGNPIYDNNIKLPTIKAIATEKIHGSNAGISYSETDGFWVQSRKNIITAEKDNAACAFNMYRVEKEWVEIIKSLAEEYNINLDENIITVYGEWAGGNIQKNSCLSGLDKRFTIFQYFKVSPIEPSEKESEYWLPTFVDKEWVKNTEANIYNVMDFPYWEVEIDFERPDLAINEIVELVKKVEENSPMGQKFGVNGNIGEGVVVQFMFKDILYRFKSKGEKHSASKVKTLKPVDSAKEQKLIDFANYATPAWRLEQAWQEMFGINNEKEEPNQKRIGDIIRLVIKDVWKEESDIAREKGIEPKEVNSKISRIVSRWIQDELDKYAGI